MKIQTLICILSIFLLLEKAKADWAATPQPHSSKVFVLTYGPGTELYSLFGHSAIRITDTENGADAVYNYGTFNWEQPHFYIKFLKGDLNYFLSKVPYYYVKEQVRSENRWMIENEVNLNPSEIQALIVYLENNLKPENREYRYDFQYDNCSSRILDLLNEVTEDTLIIDAEVLPVSSFRHLLDPYLADQPWIHAGLDLIMGLPGDKKARMLEAAFLPDYLHLFIQNYSIARDSGFDRLVLPNVAVIDNYYFPAKKALAPQLIFWSFAILMLVSYLVDSYLRKFFILTGNIILLITGILGVFLLLLWLMPLQSIFSWNTDILWANPLFVLVFALRKNQGVFTKYLLRVMLVFEITGLLSTLFVERNFALSALTLLLAIQLLQLIRLPNTQQN